MQSSYRSRRRPSRSSLFFFLLALLFIGVNYFLADDAYAAHDPEMTVEFDALELTQSRGQLVLDYAVSRSDWRAMKRAGMTPRLNLHTPDRNGRAFSFAYSLELESRLGRIDLPKAVKLRGKRVIKLKVVAFSGFSRVAQTRFKDACGDSVRVRVANPRANRGHHAAAIIKACKEFSHSHDVSGCVERAQRLRANVPPARTIEACGRVTKWNSDFNACMDEARAFRSDEPSKLIAACGAQTKWDSEFLACMQRVSSWTSRGASAMVNACGEATRWSSEFNSCLDKSGNLGQRGARVIRACDEATQWNSDFTSCLEAAVAPNHERRQRT